MKWLDGVKNEFAVNTRVRLKGVFQKWKPKCGVEFTSSLCIGVKENMKERGTVGEREGG